MKKIKLVGGLATLALLGMTNVYAKDCSELQSKIDAATNGTVVQAETCDGNLVFDANKNITLDLYGNTINTSDIKIEGDITIKDSLSNGKIVGTTKGSKAALIVTGSMTLESGAIEANGFAVIATDGSVTINGGSITAGYAAITGNNTLGSMVFEVNGGTLKSNLGPAVYMPGPISYTMTNGTIIGGLLFRMGDINISGGKINAIEDRAKLDDLKQYYNFNGYLTYPDALAVIGGTYDTKIPGQTNKLDLKITGGEFTSNHGSAVAIYDFGKKAQDMNVDIKNGTFNTNSSDRQAYQIVSLNDLGITNPQSGYNTESFIGKVKTSITGGNFNKDVTKFLTDDYVQNNGIVSKKQTETPVEPSENKVAVTAPTINTEEKVKELTVGLADTSSAQDIIAKAVEKLNITDKNVTVNVDVATIKAENVEEGNVKTIAEGLKESQPNAKIGGYFDITLNILDDETDLVLGQLSKLDKKIKFDVALPEELKNIAEGYTRTYFVVKLHDGKAEILNANLSEDKNSISFETDEFSIYALAYKDTKEENVVPKTFDGVTAYLVAGIVTLLSIIGLTSYLKKKKKQN